MPATAAFGSSEGVLGERASIGVIFEPDVLGRELIAQQVDDRYVAPAREIRGLLNQPALGVHAVQIEMAQALYMDEAPPFGLHADGGAFVGEVLKGGAAGETRTKVLRVKIERQPSSVA